MQLPRFRFTIRRMMIAVAVVGVVLGIGIERRARFGRLAETHSREYHKSITTLAEDIVHDRPSFDATLALFIYHSRMCKKYERATGYPWLPVAPDPPMPK